MAGIHWEALKLWWKGVPVVPRVTADGVGERAAQATTATDRFVEGVRSMLTRWAKTAFLSGLGGVTGGTLTVECPDRTYRYGEPGELDATLTVHDERFFLRALTGQRHRPRRVLHGW